MCNNIQDIFIYIYTYKKENEEGGSCRLVVILPTVEGLDCSAEGAERERARARVTGALLMMDRSISSSSENASARTRKRTRKLRNEILFCYQIFLFPNQKYIESVTLIWHRKPKIEKRKKK